MAIQSTNYPVPALLRSRAAKATRVFGSKRAAIVPPGSVTGRSLMIVIIIMSFLACLTTGMVYMINRSASDWLADVASEVTVQVQAVGTPAEVDARVAGISAFLSGQNGIAGVTALSADESAELIEPWLGKVEALKDLPVPRLIAVQINRDAPPDMAPLRAAVEARFPGAVLDDHRRWRSQIRRVTGTLAAAGLAIIALVISATVAIIISATRSAMASNRDIVEVLNYVGAEEKFIARQFELHFLKLGIRAGVTGALAASAVFLALPAISAFMADRAAQQAEVRRLIGEGGLDILGFGSLALVVVAIAFICRLTSRFGVKHILDAQNR